MLKKEVILDFLDKEVPLGGSAEWNSWAAECRSLPDSAAEVFIEQLKTGPKEQHYACILSLREWGYEAHGSGWGDELVYKIQPPGGREEVIVPVERMET